MEKRQSYREWNLKLLISKKITFSVGYRNFNSSVAQRYRKTEYIKSSYLSPPSYAKTQMPEKAKAHSEQMIFELKYYCFNRMLPAPENWFAYLNYAYGTVSVSNGQYYAAILTPDCEKGECSTQYVKYKYENIRTHSAQLGVGRSFFLNKWLLVGFQAGLCYTYLHTQSSGVPTIALSGFAKNYGSNVYSVGASGGQLAGDPTKSSVGVTFNIKAGVLLF